MLETFQKRGNISKKTASQSIGAISSQTKANLLYYFHQKILKQKTAVFKKQKPPLEMFHEKGVLKFYKIFRETPVSESLFD